MLWPTCDHLPVLFPQIRPSDPYHHFRTPGSSCFEKLFDQAEIERFEREIAGDAGDGDEALGVWEDEVGLGWPYT